MLVTKEGRVVILDFGLVAEVEGKELHDSVTLAGTPDYMSPEQGAQLPISRASDWYSVGVMLYQALTGRLPFAGKFFEVMMNKQNFDPPAPSELVRDFRRSSTIFASAAAAQAGRAASGREVLRILGHGKTGPLQRPIMPAPAVSTVQSRPFVGRETQLRELEELSTCTRSGQTVTRLSARQLGHGQDCGWRAIFSISCGRETAEIVVLEGRCYERESVPYKALDGVVDSLTKYLLSLAGSKAEALMPRDVLALARLFPVMLQVDAVFNAPQREQEIPDPFTLATQSVCRAARTAGPHLLTGNRWCFTSTICSGLMPTAPRCLKICFVRLIRRRCSCSRVFAAKTSKRNPF